MAQSHQDRSGERRSSDDRGAPNAKPRGRGARRADPRADSAEPDRREGAGGQIDDGPRVSPGGGRKPS